MLKSSTKVVSIICALLMLVSLVACSSSSQDKGPGKDEVIPNEPGGTQVDEKGEVEEGPNTNNGRPYNLEPAKWDTRDDKYLYGINATKLPVTDEPVTLILWRSFNSTVMQGLDESEVFKELEKRTGVKIEFVYPPVGQEQDNFNLRIATNDLPHIFSTPPEYPGGYRKAVEDGIYLELTPYYDKGLMPNVKWLRENYEEINRDIVDDEGRMFFWPMIDIVPSHPWSGIWLRKDWMEELGLQTPKTISDWDNVLRKMKEAKGVAPLAINITQWYGVKTNFMFIAAYDTGYDFINKNGKAVYGPMEPGFKDWLTKMNEWYKEGLIDPDFATRDTDSYNANIANGKAGAFGLAYGELGQILETGRSLDPKFSVEPVVQPTSYDGQVIHLRQNNSIVRGDREFFTTRLVDDGLDEIAVKWKDYWYSQDGGDLCSRGPEGVSYQWKEDGTYEWIYPALENRKEEGLDFWTLYPLFKLHNWGYLRDSTAYEFRPEVYECIDTWATQDASWVMPDNISMTPEESTEFNNIMVNVRTYVDEMTLKFITGQEPISKYDEFITNIKNMGVDRAVEIMDAALQRYLARK